MDDALEKIRLDCTLKQNPRWKNVKRDYSVEDVIKLRPTLLENYAVARHGAEKLWQLLHRPGKETHIKALGAMTGMQAVQMARAGLEAIYVSGWQVAADANSPGDVYPDQSLYDPRSVPDLVKKINRALQRQDEIEHAEGTISRDWYVPLVADAEAGFGGPLNAYELMKHLILAGSSAVHFEDQYSPAKKCGHMGGKVLVPTQSFVTTLKAARLAADVLDVPTILIARTDALSGKLLLSDVDERDHAFIDREKKRTVEGFYPLRSGIESAIVRGVAYAPYADMLWCETSTPDLEEARQFAESIHQQFPEKLLAYNCSPSFNWKKHLDDATIAKFQNELAAMGYKFQFVTLAGFHTLNLSMYELDHKYKTKGMSAYSELQQREFSLEPSGYTATRHQHEVGTGYFDAIAKIIAGGETETEALKGSTEEGQFK